MRSMFVLIMIIFTSGSVSADTAHVIGNIFSVTGNTVEISMLNDVPAISSGDFLIAGSDDLSMKVVSVSGRRIICTISEKDQARIPLLQKGSSVIKKEQQRSRRTGSFIISDDGTVTDARTGLVWMQNTNSAGNTMDWKEAVQYSVKADISGYRDWRLPSRDELAFLFKGTDRAKLREYLADAGFINICNWYWSSTEYSENKNYVWSYNIDYGAEGFNFKTSLNSIWLVRSKK